MRRTARLIGTASVGLAFALFAGACGGSTASDDAVGGDASAAETCTKERVGGSATMGVWSEAAGLDPAAAPGPGATGGSERAAIFDTLVTYDAENNEWDPQVAESVTANEDSTVWTIVLRPDITFGNGDPLTADAVAASIERHAADDAKSSVRRVFAPAEIAVIDDLTVQVTLPETWAGFPIVLAREGGMITNPSVIEADPEGFATNPIGAGVGPYEVSRYAPGEEIVLTAKDDYWGGPVCIQELRFVYIEGGQATFDALNLDELQIAMINDPSVIAQAKDEEIPAIDNPVNYAEGLLLNNGIDGADTPTSDRRLREAISLAIDPEQINARVWDGNGYPTTGLVLPDSPFAPDVDGPSQDAERAAELVKQVKADGWDGKLRMLCNNAPTRVEASLTIEAMLEAVGIEVDLNNSVSIQDLITNVLVNRDYDTACWGQGAFDSGLWLTYNTFAGDSPQNQTGYDTPEMNAGLDQLAAASTEEETREALAEMQRAWNETIPSIVYAGGNYMVPHSESVHGLKASTSAIILFHEAYVA